MSLTDEIKRMNENLESIKKEKKFKLPFKAKINKRKLKEGYVIIGEIGENRTINFSKEPIIDGSVRLDDTFHAVQDLDLFYYKKTPMLLLPKSHLNPWNPLRPQNETYGHKYVMARMHSDLIKAKRNISIGGLLIFGLIVIGAIYYFSQNGGGI